MSITRILQGVAAVAFTVGLSGTALAFHDGGVARCEGCHTMHNSYQNAVMAKNGIPQFTGNQYLLQGSDQSSTCLNCHSGTGGYKIANLGTAAGVPPVNYTPGGDFGWLQKSYTWSPRTGVTSTSAGERHGHNIVALDYGLLADTTLTSAPGGTYSAGNLACISCHDPHGKYRIMDAAGTIDSNKTLGAVSKPIHASGSYGETPTTDAAVGVYRLLAGTGYAPASNPSSPFVNNSPVAVVPSTYNRSEQVTETRVAYGTGMSEWCANCHTSIHNDGLASKLIHPASSTATLTAAVVANYNAYVKSGDLSGAMATSYTSMVPYEEGTADLVVLAPLAVNNGTQTGGPDGTENVMCLSCHRAHATGWNSMTRWNNSPEMIVLDGEWPGTDALGADSSLAKYHEGRTQAETQAAMYGRLASGYATFQRSLCNKCHAKD